MSTRRKILKGLEINPIIAAVKDEKSLDQALQSEVPMIFLLCADIFNVKSMVGKIQDAGKTAFIHMDFLSGIGRDEMAIDYLSREIKPDGIVSTKSKHIKIANEKGLATIQRFFIIDGQSLEIAIGSIRAVSPDLAEFMPGLMPEVIESLKSRIRTPIVAGGLITKKEHVISALNAGAFAISCSKKKLWNM